jgi:membrane-associated protease RseP (regulator of RpoE activity)
MGMLRGMATAGVGLALVAAVAAVAGAQVRAGAIRRAAPDSARDSMFVFQMRVDPQDLTRLYSELMASRMTEQRLALTLREVTDGDRMRSLEQQLQALARRNAALATTIRLQCARDGMEPDGYIGVNFVGITIRRENNGPAMYYFDSTRIVSVDPGTPAQRAGLEANDELIAIGGKDVSQPVPLGEMLKPGNRLPVRVRRAGQVRDLTVIVGKRDMDPVSPCASLDEIAVGPQISIITQGPGDVRVRSRNPSGGAGAGSFGAMRRTPDANGDVPNEPSTFAFLPAVPNSAMVLFAGAQLVTLDANWRDMAGTDKGLLVSRVAPGSPAESVGLKATDIIVAVGDSSVTSMASLWRLMNAPRTNGSVSLRVLRAKQPVTITYKVPDER